MPNKQEQQSPAPCSSHEPVDYADFERMTENRRSWNWKADPRMMLGECRLCHSSISYPKPADLEGKPENKPGCFEPYIGQVFTEPRIGWDGGVARFIDGDEVGITRLPMTLLAIEILSDDGKLTNRQEYLLGDDWGFRVVHITDRRGRQHRIDASRFADGPAPCFEPYVGQGIDLGVKDELERIQARAIEQAADAHTDGAITQDMVTS